jgi:hypothetical protein
MNEISELYTSNNTRGVSNIDFTITSRNLLKHTSDWVISGEDSLSDHNYIKFNINTGRLNSNINKQKTAPESFTSLTEYFIDLIARW